MCPASDLSDSGDLTKVSIMYIQIMLHYIFESLFLSLSLSFLSTPTFLQSNSAESVAMGLLRQFEGMQLPAASELDWLVPEQDAPQKVNTHTHTLTLSPYTCRIWHWTCTGTQIHTLFSYYSILDTLRSPFSPSSCCPFQTLCPSPLTTVNMQTSTSWGSGCEATWSGLRPDRRSSSTSTLHQSESTQSVIRCLPPDSLSLLPFFSSSLFSLVFTLPTSSHSLLYCGYL